MHFQLVIFRSSNGLNVEGDLAGYAIYHGFQNSNSDTIRWNTEPTVVTSDTCWQDHLVVIDNSAPSSVYYRVTAIDESGNCLNFSTVTGVRSHTIPTSGLWRVSRT